MRRTKFRAAALLAAAVLTALTACGGDGPGSGDDGDSPPAGQLNKPVEAGGLQLTVTDFDYNFVDFDVTAQEDGGKCPPADGEVYVDAGGGEHIGMNRTTEWSCTTLRKGETSRLRLLLDESGEEIEAGRTIYWIGPDGKTLAIWPIPEH